MNSEYKAVLQSVEDELPFQITWYDALESLLSIDSVLVSCEEQLDKVDLGVNYESQEAKLDKALTDRGYIEKYLENVQDYVLTNLDEKLYKWFNVKPHFIPDDFCKLFQSKSPVIKCGNDNDSKLFQS